MHPTIQMIPIEALEHHPENPRKDLGDLKELIASIKESGVMQNLTVVPNPDDEETWLVVIGNRRLEASKAAGLTELPCIISDMDHKTQLATMMAENMQRVDLTLTEQAQGVQLMMDLGMDAKEISKRTGLRKDAVERRAMMAKYDTAKAAAAIVRGGTISDFMELEKLPEEHREDMLEHVGTPNLRYHINQKLRALAEEKEREALIAKLETFAVRVEKQGFVGAKYVPMAYVTSWYAYPDGVVGKLQTPEDIRDVHYYWMVDSQGYIRLLKEDLEANDEGAIARHEKEKAFFEAQKQRAEKLDEDLRNMRYEWLMSSADLRYDAQALLKAYAIVLSQGHYCVNIDDEHLRQVEELTGLKYGGSVHAKRPKAEDLTQQIDNGRLLPVALGMIWGAIDRNNCRPFTWNWQEYCIDHKESPQYEILYDLLTDLGYQMSDEEAAYLGGTHEVYKPYEEVEGQ